MKKDIKYQNLYQDLRKQILKGDFTAGMLLPSESDLRNQYNVTQPTIRHALNLLVEERLIKKHHGKGSIVLDRPLGVGIFSLEGNSVTSQNDDDNIRTVILNGPKKTQWPDNLVFQPNDFELKNSLLLIERVRTVNDKPIFFEKLYIPDVNIEGFATLNLNNVSLYDLLGMNYQISIRGSEQKIRAVPADDQLSQLLNVHKGNALVRLDRKLETSRSNFNIYSLLYANTEEYVLYSKS